MSEKNPEIFGFPAAAALELGGALRQMRVASGGRIGGDGSMFNEMSGLLPVVGQIQGGEAEDTAFQLPAAVRERSAGLIPRIEPYIEILAGFDNPREAFVGEIGRVHSDVLSVASSWSNEFGPVEIATGMNEAISRLIENPEEESGRLPMLSAIVAARKRRPVPLAYVANLLKGREMQAFRAAAPVILPSVRDLLPANGAEVTRRFAAVKDFLAP